MTTLFRLPRRTPAGQHRLGASAQTRPAPVTGPDVAQALEPFRDVLDGQAPLTDDVLARVRDGLRATMTAPVVILPAEPEDAPEPPPVPGPEAETFPSGAQLRAVIGGRNSIHDPLGAFPAYAGWAILPDGRPVAGMYLGTNTDGHFVLDATDPAWCDAAIEALARMRDDLAATADAGEGNAA